MILINFEVEWIKKHLQADFGDNNPLIFGPKVSNEGYEHSVISRELWVLLNDQITSVL